MPTGLGPRSNTAAKRTATALTRCSARAVQDGMLRGAELSGLSTLITTQGEPLSAEEAQEFFDELDADEDGVVRKWEYMRIMSGDAESTEERVD